jgi:hypothetical protein
LGAATLVVDGHYTVEQVIKMVKRRGMVGVQQIDPFQPNILAVGR